MLCLKKRRTYSFTQGACAEAPRHRRRSASSTKRDASEPRYTEAVNVATLPRKLTPREERSSAMVLTVTEDTPADMLAGSMELLVQMPRDHHVQTQRVTVQRSTPMMDLLVQIATAHKLAASSYTLQAIGERGLVLPHQPNTPIGALDALQVKLLPKQGTFLPRKSRQTNQPFETTFRLQVHLPRNQLYVSRVSPKTNLGEILDEVCREKNLDRNKYELRHPAHLAETLDLSLSLQDYHLQEVTLCARQQGRAMLGSALSSQDIMALQRQEECRRQQSRHQSVFGFMFKKSKESSSLSIDSIGNRSVSPARSDETARSCSPQQHQLQQQLQQRQTQPLAAPPRPLRKRRPAPKPPTQQANLQNQQTTVTRSDSKATSENGGNAATTPTADKDKIVISHSRNSSDSSGYHEASVLSDNPDNGASQRMPETLPRRGRMQGILEAPRKLAHTSQASKSLGNLAIASSHGGTLSRGISNTSLSSAGQRKKRAAPPPPIARPLPSAISTQGLERIVDSDESLTSDMELSKPSSDIDAAATGSSKASSDIGCHVRPIVEQPEIVIAAVAEPVESARVVKKDPPPPVPKPRKVLAQVDASRVPSTSSSSDVGTSFGLPSLTEDEREEIALAIDSIVEAARGHSELSSESDDTERRDDVFLDAVSSIEKIDEIVEVPEGFRDEDVSIKSLEVPKEADGKEDSNVTLDNVKSGDIEIASGIQERKNSQASEKSEENKEKVKPEVVEKSAEEPKVTEKTEVERKIAEKSEEERKLAENSKEVQKITEKSAEVQKTVEKSEEVQAIAEKSEVEPKVTGKSEDKQKVVENCQDDSSISEEAEDSGKREAEQAATADAVSEKEVKFELSADDVEYDGSAKRLSCAVISTIPKCDHLTDSDFVGSPEPVRKRGKILRSQSEMSHFEFGPVEKHARHLTSNGEAFTFALNPNLGADATRRIEASIAASGKGTPTDTDILLQKVSDTLSHSFTPASPPPTPEDSSLEPPSFATLPSDFDTIKGQPLVEITNSVEESAKAKRVAEEDAEVTSANNLTIGSTNQQDTSDYVSASGEDLSIGDWEYQIPAPPSEFRDQDDDAVEPASEKKEPTVPAKLAEKSISVEAEVHQTRPEKVTKPPTPPVECKKQPPVPPKSVPAVEPKPQPARIDPPSVDSVDCSHVKVSPQLSLEATEQKKAEVISELETRIQSNKPIVEPVVLKDESYAPKIAPVENNLSNFTITTYSRTKSVDIFEPMEHHSESRVISTFATLTRGRCVPSDYADEKPRNGMLKNAQSMERMTSLVDDRVKYVERNNILREKASVHRSNSYIVLSSNEKFSNKVNELEKIRDEKKVDERMSYQSNGPTRKYTSLANINSSTNEEIPRHKEKFSQWRENILRKQEEPTKEKQLQSLQVLKSILPQLKNAQATEENGFKNTSDSFTAKKRQESQREETPEPLTVSSNTTTATSEVQLRTNRRPAQEPTKRYTYGGPPSVSLGSWSERPSINVQIKTDTDYKFGSKSNATSGARTVVNLNGGETGERMQNGEVHEKKEVGKVSPAEVEKKEEPLIETTSVNFKELTKAFSRADRTPPKPPVRNPAYRHLEYIERPKNDTVVPKQNGFIESHVSMTTIGAPHNRTNGPVPPVKRYTSVVGIANNVSNNVNSINNANKNNNNNNANSLPVQQPANFRFANGTAAKKEPIVTVPKPPTMPIITGVTLKSVNARPKSSPPTIQADPRDQLLDSIRNFGGRGKLRSVANRH